MSSSQTGCFSFLSAFWKQKRSQHGTMTDSVQREMANYSWAKDLPVSYTGILCACELASAAESDQIWRLEAPPRYTTKHFGGLAGVFRPEVLKTIEQELDNISTELRELSLKIHGHPELAYQEKYAHDILTEFMSSHGFEVTKHYLGLETAWKASFSHGRGGRVIGVNSEMDALPGIGHACGHNLIAIVGVGTSLGIKAALEKHNVSARIVLLGTPAEEGGAGKAKLIELGAYKEMNACLMAHPGPGPAHSAGTGSCKAIQALTVEYFGHTAHASAAPWEGENALDAAVIAYSSVSVMRQQIKPDYRIHGIIEGRDWAANIIPDYAKMSWIVRAPTWKETEVLRDRVINCLKAAALATSTEYKLTMNDSLFDLVQNDYLAQDFTEVMTSYGSEVSPTTEGAIGGSTDFGNVTYVVPALHPSYAIPTKPNGGNHTTLFTEAAATQEAHDASIVVAKALAHTGFRVVDDDGFYKNVKNAFNNKVKV